jgi:predicted P-loop ATPase
LTAIENADLLNKLETELQSNRQIESSEKARLKAVLSSGSLTSEELSVVGVSRAAARS